MADKKHSCGGNNIKGFASRIPSDWPKVWPGVVLTYEAASKLKTSLQARLTEIESLDPSKEGKDAGVNLTVFAGKKRLVVFSADVKRAVAEPGTARETPIRRRKQK